MRELCDELDGSAARIQSIKARGSAFWTIGIVYALAHCVRLSVCLSPPHHLPYATTPPGTRYSLLQHLRYWFTFTEDEPCLGSRTPC